MNATHFGRIVHCGLVVCLLSSAALALAQQSEIKLWPGVAPGSEKWTQKEVWYKDSGGDPKVRNIVSPSLSVFLPDPAKATGAAMVIAPGGAMLFLSWGSEGTEVARSLNSRGIAAFVLKYRVRQTPADQAEFEKQLGAMLGGSKDSNPTDAAAEKAQKDEAEIVGALAITDARQAVSVVRQRASEWKISSQRIGLMGFSSGAWLTTSVLTSYDAASRPNFAAAIYGGQAEEAKTPADAPPLFILSAADDPFVPPAASTALFTAWTNTHHSAELHIYAAGGHGFGMRKQGLPIDHWVDRLAEWMEQQGVLDAGRGKQAAN